DATVHLEILRAKPSDTAALGHDEIVLYLDDLDGVSSATARLREAGITPDSEGHPYWQANGAVTYRDPDGRGLVLAPWVFGRVADPVDRPPVGDDGGAEDDLVNIDWYQGHPHLLRALFE